MRHSGNIFRLERYRGTGIRTFSPVSLVTVVLTSITIVSAIYIIANFGDITARVAIWMANFLSSGFPVLVIIVAAIYLVMRFKWKLRRRFWGW